MRKKSKILNKLLTVLMVVLIVAALCVPAFAADIVILPETTVNFDNGEGFISGEFPVIVGETYTVTWNGTAYECIAQDASSFSPGAAVLGNGSAIGLSGNGEPFILACEPGTGLGVLSVDSSISSATISISGPDSGSASVRNYILSPVTIPDDGLYNGTYTIEMVEGESYFVSVNGVEQVLVCEYFKDLDAAGYFLSSSDIYYFQSTDFPGLCAVRAAAGSTVSVYTKVPPFEALVNNVGSLVSGSVGWVGQFVSAVTSNALLLCFMIVIFVGVGVGLISRIKK